MQRGEAYPEQEGSVGSVSAEGSVWRWGRRKSALGFGLESQLLRIPRKLDYQTKG